jgi:uncharacterized SAM-binding protein YcdF (DUF218 family)
MPRNPVSSLAHARDLANPAVETGFLYRRSSVRCFDGLFVRTKLSALWVLHKPGSSVSSKGIAPWARPEGSIQARIRESSMDILNLLTRLILWIAIGSLIWWLLRKFIPETFLTWFGGAIVLMMVAIVFLVPESSTANTLWNVVSFPLGKDPKKVDARLVYVAFTILLLSSIPLVARTLANQAEDAVQRAYANQQQLCADICPAIDDVPVDRAVSIVVLGDNADSYRAGSSLPSRIDSGNSLPPSIVARLNSTGDVYNRIGLAQPFVTVTAGPRTEGDQSQELQQAIRQRLVNQGVPSDRIRITSNGLNIRQVVQEQQNFLREQNLLPDPERENNRDASRVVLVAPALTMRRAALAFENEGIQVVAWPTDLYGTDPFTQDGTIAQLVDLVPSVEALQVTTRYWEELLSSMYYFMRGWLPSFNVRWDQVVETLE